MRLIDADAIVATLRKRSQSLKGTYGDLGGACSGAARLIEIIPTVDAIPCSFCRFTPPSMEDGKPCGMCPAEGR